MEHDIEKMYALSERACSLNYADACGNLGNLYFEGIGVDKNINTANSYFKKGCESGSSISCYNYGNSYLNGTGVKRNKKTAKSYYGKSCDFGSQAGCEAYKKLKNEGF